MKKKIRNIGLFGKYIKDLKIYQYLENNYSIYFLDEHQDYNIFSNSNLDLIIIYGYGRILKQEFIDQVNSKVINFHGGYLPYGRGIFPQLWSTINDKPTGFSIHEINSSLVDDGPILYREIISYDANDTYFTLFNRIKDRLENYVNKNIINIINE